MRIFSVALFGTALLLSGCIGLSRSVATQPLSSAEQGLQVTQIHLDLADDVRVTDEFEAIFQDRVAAALAECATGNQPVRLEAHIDRLDKANPYITAVIAGANVLRGTARLVDPETEEILAQYNIGRTIIGGRVAVIRMAEAEEQLSEAYGIELCNQAFGDATTDD